MKTIALQLHKNEYSWVVKIETPQRPLGLGQYDRIGEYCGPHTASYTSITGFQALTTG